MTALIAAITFIFGLVCGSFIDTIAERWGQDTSILGRSHCNACGYVLGWNDLLPLISFLALRGACRKCGTRIPRRHFFTEILTGVVFMLLFIASPVSRYITVLDESSMMAFFIYFISACIIAGAILAIMFSDARFYIIPDSISLPMTGFVLAYAAFLEYAAPRISLFSGFLDGVAPFSFHVVPPFLDAVAGSFVAAAFFFGISFISKGQWMGWGDGKFALFLGALFGWPFIITIIFMAFVLGSFAGIALIVRQKATMKSLLPFGVFLGISALFFQIIQNTHAGAIIRLFATSFVTL